METERLPAGDARICVTLVIAASDPGYGNFLDAAGHRCGIMTLRWTAARTPLLPNCRLEKLVNLQQGQRSPKDHGNP